MAKKQQDGLVEPDPVVIHDYEQERYDNEDREQEPTDDEGQTEQKEVSTDSDSDRVVIKLNPNHIGTYTDARQHTTFRRGEEKEVSESEAERLTGLTDRRGRPRFVRA